jgi:tetratricopeptide (TPR) repeat protein
MYQSWYLVLHHGKSEIARPIVRRLLDIDPLSPTNYMVAGMMHVMLGDYKQALDLLYKPYEIESKFMKWGWMWISYTLAMYNQFDEAFGVIDKAVKEDPNHPASMVMSFYKYAFMGDSDKALGSLSEEMKAWFWDDPDLVWPMAGCYSRMGELDKSLDLIERALDRGWTNYPVFAEIDPLFENVRSEPRFKKLMERVKHEWENFEV